MSEIKHIREHGYTAILIIALGLALISTSLFVSIATFPSLSVEHGLMENFQAVGLLVACALFLYHSKTGIFGHVPALAWTLSLFCLTFFLLEFDTRPFGIDVLSALTNGMIRNLWLGLLWLVVGFIALRDLRNIWPYFITWLTSLSGLSMCVSGLFWIISRLLEDGGYSYVISPFFLEELMEVNAVILMIISSYLTQKNVVGHNISA